ncbi:hypothetical protein ACGYLO_17675 [Sulfitobacter sp. 1A13353]|uniref:hypothetical protein n=1 Tax=Sulfitobacter sp. 1A13353 TaxID=3368568 RepID=UPI0037475288
MAVDDVTLKDMNVLKAHRPAGFGQGDLAAPHPRQRWVGRKYALDTCGARFHLQDTENQLICVHLRLPATSSLLNDYRHIIAFAARRRRLFAVDYVFVHRAYYVLIILYYREL